MSVLVKKSLVDQIYTELRNSIITQKISWGEKLNVSELQQKYAISSTPIREALNRLQKEGLIEYRNNFGARVIDIGIKDIIEIQEVAFTLDAAAIRYAILGGRTEEMIGELAAKIKGYRDAEDEMKRAFYTQEFIGVFYKYSENQRLISLSYFIKGQQSMLKSIYVKMKKGLSGMDDHIRIYDAVQEGNVAKAIEALEDNYEKATEFLKNSLNENK